MRLLDLNVGIKLDNNKEVIKLIEDTNPTLVILQEATRGLEEGVLDLYNSANIIKNGTDYPYSFFGPLWVASHHEKNGVVSRQYGGLIEQGNYTLSKYKMLSSSNIFYHQHYGEFIDTTNFRVDDHPRAFTKTMLEVEEKQLLLIHVHGIWTKDKLGDDRTISQVWAIINEAKKYDCPVIVAGDFNLLLESPSIDVMNQHFRNLILDFSISSTRPCFDDGLDTGDIICDYVFVNDKVQVSSLSVVPVTISDHYPLILEFELREDDK